MILRNNVANKYISSRIKTYVSRKLHTDNANIIERFAEKVYRDHGHTEQGMTKYGRIVQVASIAGKEGNPKMAPYNTAKSGLIGFVKGVAKEVATDGITINSLAPAVIATPINVNTAKETLDYMISKIPAGRLGEPNEVAEMIAFMGSKACSFTTGFTFDISGGRATY